MDQHDLQKTDLMTRSYELSLEVMRKEISVGVNLANASGYTRINDVEFLYDEVTTLEPIFDSLSKIDDSNELKRLHIDFTNNGEAFLNVLKPVYRQFLDLKPQHLEEIRHLLSQPCRVNKYCQIISERCRKRDQLTTHTDSIERHYAVYNMAGYILDIVFLYRGEHVRHTERLPIDESVWLGLKQLVAYVFKYKSLPDPQDQISNYFIPNDRTSFVELVSLLYPQESPSVHWKYKKLGETTQTIGCLIPYIVLLFFFFAVQMGLPLLILLTVACCLGLLKIGGYLTEAGNPYPREIQTFGDLSKWITESIHSAEATGIVQRNYPSEFRMEGRK